MNFIEASRKLISIDSSPASGTLEVARFVAEYGRGLGFEVEHYEDSLGGVAQANVILRPPGVSGPEELMLQSHLDTTDPGPYRMWSLTQENPFNATIHDGHLYGLGAAEVKLDFLAKIQAAAEFLNSPRRRPFVIVGTYGEESGMTGAIRLIRRKRVRPRRALISEPTGLALGHAGVGTVVVETIVPFTEEEKAYRADHDLMESASSQSRFFYGKAAHSSRPELGENAIVKMLDYLTQLPDGIAVLDLDGGTGHAAVPASAVLEFDMVGALRETVVPKLGSIVAAMRSVETEFASYRDEGFLPEYPTLNLGQARTLQDHVWLLGSCRLLPSVPEQVAEKWLTRLRESCEAVGSLFRIVDYKRPFLTPGASDFAKGCQAELAALGLVNGLAKISAPTEASVFGRLGVECLVFGPGQGIGNSHAPNERISLSELEQATAFYKRVIQRFCL